MSGSSPRRLPHGEAIITRAKDEGRALLDQVQEARRRVLADLASRRRGLGIQIEQLRAARDEMAASVHGVRDRVDGILTQLDRTDEEARAAAQGVADQFRLGTAELPHDQDDTDHVTGEAPPTGPDPGRRRARHGRRRRGGAGGPFGRRALRPHPRRHGGSEAPRSRRRRRLRPPPRATRSGGADVPGPAKAKAKAERRGARPRARPKPTPAEEPAAARPSSRMRRSSPAATTLLTPISSKLSRTIKRHLGDDQNRLLDRLRSAPALEADELMGSEDEHLAAFAAGGAQPPRRGLRRRHGVRGGRGGDHSAG